MTQVTRDRVFLAVAAAIVFVMSAVPRGQSLTFHQVLLMFAVAAFVTVVDALIGGGNLIAAALMPLFNTTVFLAFALIWLRRFEATAGWLFPVMLALWTAVFLASYFVWFPLEGFP